MNHEQRLQCQLLLFPGGITLNSEKKISTKNLSPLYTLKPTKKDLSDSEKSLMVELAGNTPASAKRRRYRTTSLVCLNFLTIKRLNKPNVL